MCLFFACLIKIVPLYMNILMGYFAAKFLDLNRENIARLMFYMINPIVVFNGVIHTHLDTSVLMLPFLTFGISSLLCLFFYRISKSMWHDSSRNLLAFSAGTGNTGYFGLPMALLLFDDQGEGAYIMGLLGVTFFENTLGFYILSRKGDGEGAEKQSPLECFYKLFTLPALYAFLAGLLVNVSQIGILEIFSEFMQHIKGAYAVLGMMIIGLGLAGLKHFKIDYKFVGMAFIAKFFAWPVIALTVIHIGRMFGYVNNDIYNALMLVSIVPLAVNTVIMASLLKTQPEKAATAVLASIIFALAYVPIMANYFIK